MSVRGAEDGALTAGSSDANERRDSPGQRVHFEALVAIGETGTGAGFEAESIDVSTKGMRLRTAYLPAMGEKLICRFEGLSSDLVVEGEVAWRQPHERGGEFGLRFLGLDERALECLRGLCTPRDGSKSAPAPEAAAKGTRVRLHIEGLGSPMKARVREAGHDEVQVGSNLEFLKVGRALELEDVDHGSKREAIIDHVRVEIDATTNVPQLVVALRCDGAGKRGSRAAAMAAKTVPEGTKPPATDEGPRANSAELSKVGEGTPGPIVVDESDPEMESQSEAVRAGAVHADGAKDAEAEGADDAEPAFLSASAKAKNASLRAARRIGPAVSAMGLRAKAAASGALMLLQKRRAEREEAKKASMPRRMTAPPPTGALKSEGRRLVRDDMDEELPPLPTSNKKAAVIGSMIGLVAVLGVFGATRALSARSQHSASAPVETVAPAKPAALAAGTANGGAVSAEVPLFGATPLSTTEAVPSAPGSAAPAADARPGSDPGADGYAAADDSADEGAGAKEWGNGPVKNPNVLRIKMDGPIEGLHGAPGAMGFTISLPGRRSLSSSSAIARKDKRIAALNVVNTAHGAEVTIQFKDGVPPYLARAKGDRLEIALGSEGKKNHKVAKSTSKGSEKSHKSEHKAKSDTKKKKNQKKN